jgi:galactarate dehydratase
MMQNIVIKTNPNDNVAIVANPSGLKRGSIVLDGIVLEEDIPITCLHKMLF